MVFLFFVLPGAGKTTVLTSLALKYSQPYSQYKRVFHNVKSLCVPGATYIDNSCIGKYDLSNSLILIDEAQLFADNRDYKSFSSDLKEFFFGHRHEHVDIYLFSQQWDSLDKKIRSITDRVYYVYKTKLTGFAFSNYYRIPYDIIIPDPRKNQQSLGEIIQGYCKPPVLVRLFGTTRLYRPKYYPYFDSFEVWTEKPPLPEQYKREPWSEKQRNLVKRRRKIKSFIKKVKDFFKSFSFINFKKRTSLCNDSGVPPSEARITEVRSVTPLKAVK